MNGEGFKAVSRWRFPLEVMPPARGELHVWRVPLREGADPGGKGADLLSPEERERADRLKDPVKRREFVLTRAALRSILSCYVPLGPRDFRFHYNEFGKPSLAPEHGRGMPAFNVSRSHGTALCVIGAPGRRLGIDIEYLRPGVDCLGIARREFAPGETALLLSLSGSERLQAFFRIWTRKEAYLKATGEGLSVPLSHFDTSSWGGPGHPVPGKCRGGLQGWSLRDLSPGEGYTAALAAEGELDGLLFRDLNAVGDEPQ